MCVSWIPVVFKTVSQSGDVSFVRRVVGADVEHFDSTRFSASPLRPISTTFRVEADILEAMLVSSRRIDHVCGLGDPAKIFRPVVRFIAVDVIAKHIWCGCAPRKPAHEPVALERNFIEDYTVITFSFK